MLLVPSWVLSLFFFVTFLRNSGWLPKNPTAAVDMTYLIVASIFFLSPFVSRLKIGKLVEFERRLEETRADVQSFKQDTRQMLAIFSQHSASANVTIGNLSEGQKKKDEIKSENKPRTAMEFKILNTLWNRQVLKFPDLNTRFTFRINQPAPEFIPFLEAGISLMREGLITETDFGQFMLTNEGFRYCAEHYKEFPSDMWFDYFPLEEDNLKKALQRVEDLTNQQPA